MSLIELKVLPYGLSDLAVILVKKLRLIKKYKNTFLKFIKLLYSILKY